MSAGCWCIPTLSREPDGTAWLEHHAVGSWEQTDDTSIHQTADLINRREP